MVWACNLCDHGFDSSVEIKNHMQSKHDKILDIETAGGDHNKHIDLHEDTQEGKDKEDKEEILHDAATLALAFGPSSASEMKRKEARDRSLASPLIFKSGSFVYLEGASGAGAIGSAALGLLLNQFIGQSLLRQQAKPLFSEDPPPALGDSALL